MTDAEKYVAVFRAAAKGVMEPYPPLQVAPGSGTGPPPGSVIDQATLRGTRIAFRTFCRPLRPCRIPRSASIAGRCGPLAYGAAQPLKPEGPGGGSPWASRRSVWRGCRLC